MTGEDHYREAERILASTKDRDLPAEVIAATAAVVQAHAALAVASVALGHNN